MRLTRAHQESIVRIIRQHAGADAGIWLYGSRTRDDRRGGDVDLLVQASQPIDLARQAAIQSRLEAELLLPVDLSFVDARRGMTRFQKLAAVNALPLEATP